MNTVQSARVPEDRHEPAHIPACRCAPAGQPTGGHPAHALVRGETALRSLAGATPRDRRDRVATLLTIYDLHTAPLETVRAVARWQGHPRPPTRHGGRGSCEAPGGARSSTWPSSRRSGSTSSGTAAPPERAECARAHSRRPAAWDQRRWAQPGRDGRPARGRDVTRTHRGDDVRPERQRRVHQPGCGPGRAGGGAGAADRRAPNPKCLHALFRGAEFGPDEARAVAAARQRAAQLGSPDEARVVGRTLFLRTPCLLYT